MAANSLWELREWLTLALAATYLSTRLQQRVTEADVLRLALDGRLTLSVYLPSGTEATRVASEGEKPPTVRRVDGVWDLSMTGGGRRQVEHEYNRRCSLPWIPMQGSAGAVVEQRGERWQLSPYEGGPQPGWLASALPDGSTIVVRRTALDALVPSVTAQVQEPPSTAVPSLTSWEQLVIEFTSEHRVQVTGVTAPQTYNYGDLGFADGRTGNPTLAWETLRTLAEEGGTMKVPMTDRSKVEKRVEEIRRALRAHFVGTLGDPLPYDKETHTYSAQFRIGVRPSYDT